MSKNPLDEYLAEKTAGPLGQFGQAFGGAVRNGLNPGVLGGRLAGGMMAAGGAALGAGAIAGAGAGASKLYAAVTKARDFKQMLEVNPDIAAEHVKDPALVNRMFSTLRTFNPQFSQDPTVAGTYVRNMVNSPLTAGGVAVEALQHRQKMPGGGGVDKMMGAAQSAKAPGSTRQTSF